MIYIDLMYLIDLTLQNKDFSHSRANMNSQSNLFCAELTVPIAKYIDTALSGFVNTHSMSG